MRLLLTFSLVVGYTWAFPDQGVWDFVLHDGSRSEFSVVKCLFKDSSIFLFISCEDFNNTNPTALKITWELRRSECWRDYLRADDNWIEENGTHRTGSSTEIKCSDNTVLQGVDDGKNHEVLRTPTDGFYALYVKVESTNSGKWSASVSVRLKGPHGYLGAAAWPLLPFYAASCAVHLALGAGWLAACAARWRDLLRLQLWLGAVLLLAMLEAAAFYAALANANATGAPAYTPLGEALSCTKRALARALVLVAALGFGLVRPRLGPARGRVAALAALYLAAAGMEAWARAAHPQKSLLMAALPLALLDAAFFWWVFSALVSTTRTLRLRRNLVKLELYRWFTNVLFCAVLVSAAFMAYSIHVRHITVCFREWRVLWLDEAFWKILFMAILFAMMILWRPTHNNRRYAFSPLTDVGDSEEEDEQPVSDAYGVKQRLGSPRTRRSPAGSEEDLRWVEEHIPAALADSALPILDSDEDIVSTRFELSKMQ